VAATRLEVGFIIFRKACKDGRQAAFAIFVKPAWEMGNFLLK
jgi:hypothetical protein